MNSMKLTCRTPSPLGTILLVANSSGDALAGLYLDGQKYYPDDADAFRDSPRLPVFREAVTQLREYFAGTRTEFDLPLAPGGTTFQRGVWSTISGVPFGATISYGELARRVGPPGTPRNVGATNGRNPIALIVPCHRVIGADGSLTGYGGGLERKRLLLELEAGVLSLA